MAVAQLESLGHRSSAKHAATMNNTVALLYAVSAVLGSSALAVNAATRFWTAVAKRKTDTTSQAMATKSSSRLGLVFLVIGIIAMITGFSALGFLLSQSSKPVENHHLVLAAMAIINVVTGNQLVQMAVRRDNVA